MVIVYQNNSGFSVLEMLLCICVVSSLMLVSINGTNKLNLEHYYFLNDYLYHQSEAIDNCEEVSAGKGVYFNSMGHVNQARTIEFDNRSIIVHVGNGYAFVK